MKWMEPFYTGDIEASEIEGMKKEAEECDMRLYGTRAIIVLPYNKNNLFEIMSFHQLTIPYYKTLDLKAVAFARDKQDAENVLCRIIEDMEKAGKGFKVDEFFKIKKAGE